MITGPLPQSSVPRRLPGGCRACLLTLGLLIGGAVGCLGALLLSGMGYQAWGEAQDLAQYPPPGQLVDVGGYRLHLYCTGVGTPTVIMDAGHASTVLDWAWVQSELSATTRVCTVDRAGNGWSDPGPGERTSKQIVAELHTLLDRAAVPEPYLMVGHSFGGYTARLYTIRYPEEVAGIVLVDSSMEKLLDALPPEIRAAQEKGEREEQGLFQGAGWLARLGILRLGVAHFGTEGLTFLESIAPPVRPAYLSRTFLQTGFYTTAVRELAAMEQSAAQLRGAGPLPKVPLIVIVRGWSDSNFQNPEWNLEAERVWRTLQREVADSVPGGRLVIADHSNHYIPGDQPEVIIQSIREIVDQIRKGR